MSKRKLPEYIYLFYIVGGMENTELYDWLSQYKESSSENGKICIDIDSNIEENIFFYGYTTSKKLAKSFISERNQSKITCIRKSSYGSFSDYSEFEKFEKEFRICKILTHTMVTRKHSKNDGDHIASVTLTITEFEREFMDISFEGIDDRWYDAYNEIQKADIIFGCMTKKCKDHLSNIGFLSFIKYLKALYSTTHGDVPVVYLDEFKIFFDYFKELFIGGESK